LTLTAMNESASKKKRPFEYHEKAEEGKTFALKDLDPEQMREINQLLMQYIEVPRAHSLPSKRYIPSPDMRPEALMDERLDQDQRELLMQQQNYFKQTGQKIEGKY
jgi:hypothetical protein